MKSNIGYIIAVNGAFIATVGAWAFEWHFGKWFVWTVRLIGCIFIIIGVGLMIFE